METEYNRNSIPDLKVIYDKVLSVISPKLIYHISMETFLQTWPDTAGGFSEPGMLSGRAMTEGYVTVVTVDLFKDAAAKDKTLYITFFGNEGAYVTTDPKPAFFKDIKDHHMQNKYDALHSDRY